MNSAIVNRPLHTLIEWALVVVAGVGMGVLFVYALATPDPIRDQLGQEAAAQAREMELRDFHECMDRLLTQDDPTDAEYAAAEEWCR